MENRTHELTEGEWAIIQVVWEKEPCIVPAIQEELQARKNWHYSTVKTLMDRMVDKGLLTTERFRNLILYRSAITRIQAQKGEIMRAVKRAFNGALTPMMQFMLDEHKLSQKQLAELESLIRKKRSRSGGRKKR